MLSRVRLVAAVIALLLCAAGIVTLERDRAGLVIAPLAVGTTPATVYRRDDGARAPVVVIAHGFAGSRQLMEAYALTLARAGYVAVSFDFEGHGRNPVPMSGDATRVSGTTQLLMDEIGRVTDAALALPQSDGRLALLGHSMASDIIVRRAEADPRVAASVAISMFSGAVTSDAPKNLLMISGAWESFLRADALKNLRLAAPGAEEGDTIGGPSAPGGARRATVAPGVEHVGVLYSATGLAEARAWLDAVFGRTSGGPVAATGGAILMLLAGIVLLAWPLAALLPQGAAAPAGVPLRTFLLATLVPAMATPLALAPVDTHVLPVLVADYLAAHLFVYGVMSLAILHWQGVRIGPMAWVPAAALTLYGIAVFGSVLDRYVASFMPVAERLPIIAAIAAGAVPCMLAMSLTIAGGRAPLWRTLVARGAFLASLGAAVALDFERLMFLLIILPVILLFFAVFGTMAGWVGRRSLSPAAVGLATGLILAWSLGVTFPLFSAS